MHIPDAMLQGKICPVTAIISVVSIGVAILSIYKKKEAPAPRQFGAVAALIFVAQMMNFPILNGVSGHLVGSVLATNLLGWPLAVLAMSLVIAIQSLLFSDGGITVLGANILNMAIIGTAAGEGVRVFLRSYTGSDSKIELCQRAFLSLSQAEPIFESRAVYHPSCRYYLALAAASWVSVMASAFAASIEIILSGNPNIIVPMLSIHALIGLGEALITCVALSMLARTRKAVAPLALAALVALFASWTSADPDGLEWAAQKSGIWSESTPHFYSMGISIPTVAAFVGGLASFTLAYFFLRWCKKGFKMHCVH